MEKNQLEILRRRTFAIISHPDAGKTTITEKILYNGGVIREAGEVKGKAGKKTATSDWMTLEKERGVSITSSVMQFEMKGLMINLLDTPGHKDFGEDTYRTLHAADSAAMLIDAAKGVEEQTRKLYEVCRLRQIPIFTFANKMDREGKDPLELIDDIEETLGMTCYPVTWPIGMGDLFKGVYHRLDQCLYLYTKGKEEPERVPLTSWRDSKLKQYIRESFILDKFLEDMELVEGVSGEFLIEEFLSGKISPLTFGSAKFNWGVDHFLDVFGRWAPAPQNRLTNEGDVVSPLRDDFSGFIFKIQANMDRKHRDRIAFVRICSGRFERGMKVKHARLERELRLAYASQFMAQDRDTVDEAFAGDIVGVVDSGNFQIGDTLYEGSFLSFEKLPRFSPECFGRLNIKDPLKRRQMQKAVLELAEEGAVQVFYDPLVGTQEVIVGVVGDLQFDVLLFRLNDEYKLDVKLERLALSAARWPKNKENQQWARQIKGGTRIYQDLYENPVLLLEREWDLRWLEKENPEVEFHFTA